MFSRLTPFPRDFRVSFGPQQSSDSRWPRVSLPALPTHFSPVPLRPLFSPAISEFHLTSWTQLPLVACSSWRSSRRSLSPPRRKSCLTTESLILLSSFWSSLSRSYWGSLYSSLPNVSWFIHKRKKMVKSPLLRATCQNRQNTAL